MDFLLLVYACSHCGHVQSFFQMVSCLHFSPCILFNELIFWMLLLSYCVVIRFWRGNIMIVFTWILCVEMKSCSLIGLPFKESPINLLWNEEWKCQWMHVDLLNYCKVVFCLRWILYIVNRVKVRWMECLLSQSSNYFRQWRKKK